ncbi:MAG: hypothetical protein K2H67_08000, partial [Treponemataceae bacterium]|nr:hypothetical protein [Treponemataceae bacterium]
FQAVDASTAVDEKEFPAVFASPEFEARNFRRFLCSRQLLGTNFRWFQSLVARGEQISSGSGFLASLRERISRGFL